MGKRGHIKAVNEYFAAWLKQDETIIPRLFAEDIVYIECTGTVYLGKAQCERWFTEWNQEGRVLKWDILKTYEIGDTIIVQWYFECEYEKNTDGFNGVSVITLNDEGLIKSVQEYYAKAEQNYPYGKTNS